MPVAPLELLDRVQTLLRQDQAAEAAALLLQLVAQHPDSIEAWFALGQAQGMLERHAEAESAFRHAARLRPGMHEAHFNLALSLAYQRKLVESIGSFVAARRLNANIPGLGQTLLNTLLEILQDEHHADAGSNGAFPALAGMPLVSVIIPTQNRVHLLRDALQSVSRQTYPNWEVIVINDGGEDISTAVTHLPGNLAARFNCLRSESPRGQASARNTGVDIARGEVIAFLDDDDLFKPDHLEQLVSGLRASGAALAYTRAEAVWEHIISGRRVDIRRGPAAPWFRYSRALLLARNAMPLQNCAVRRECFEKYGKFDSSLRCAEDWDLLLRFSAHVDFHQVNAMTTEIHVRDEVVDSVSKRNRLKPVCEMFYRRFPADGHALVELARELYLEALP